MTERVAADTDDLDEFVAVGDRLQVSVAGMWETLARQRNDLLGIGLRTVVERSEIAAVGNTIGAMAELDRFVTNISAALQRYGEDLGDGRFRAAVSVVDNRLDHANDPRFDALEAALAAEGLRPADAARIRDEVEAIVGYDSRFQIDGVTASEPGRLAAVLVADIQRRAADLIENNHVGSSSLHSEPVVSVDRLASDLHFGFHIDEFVPVEALDDALRGRLTDEEYRELHDRLVELESWEQAANVSLVANADGEVALDGDAAELHRAARELRDDSRTEPGMYGARLDEPEIAFQLQRIAQTDPGRAVGIKWMLDRFLDPHERAELNRVLATGGTFSERVGLATAHPRDGLTGAVKGGYNENFGWWADYWADAQVVTANGLYAMAANSTGSEHAPRVPDGWDEHGSIVELEFEMDNIAEQGGADVALMVELASTAYGVGKAGLTIVRVGRRYFLRSGDELVAGVGQDLATQLDETAEPSPAVGRSTNPVDDAISPADGSDLVSIPESAYRPVRTPGRLDHVLHGNINGFGRASGGHYLRSRNIRLTRTIDVDPNGVVRAETAIRGPGGHWVDKLDRQGNLAISTFFPQSWTQRRTMIEIDTAFRNSAPIFTDMEMPHHRPRPWPEEWQGQASNGVLIEGRYNVPGDPGQGWSTAYPIYEG